MRQPKIPSPPANCTEERVATRTLAEFAPHQVYPSGPTGGHSPIAKPIPGLINRRTRVGSVGSCFSFEIRKWLLAHGYNYLQTAVGPTSSYGSCRFGILLTAASLCQTFEAAFGEATREEWCWPFDGRLIDPYRKNIVWQDEASARAELDDHDRSIRELVANAQVFICTLGASEYWRSRADHQAFATVPPHGVLDPARHEFVVASVDENLRSIEAFYTLLKRHNPALRLVLSLSPVPLTATYRDLSCVVADSFSKASLRVAIDTFCTRHPEVVYMPSYEIVTKLTPQPYREDNRHVREEVVAHIMRTFMENFGDLAPSAAESRPSAA